MHGATSIDRRTLLLGGTAALAAGPRLGRAEDRETVRLGWIRPTTGRLASSFAPTYLGGLIAVDEINASGGIMGRRIERVEEDDEASPAKEPAIMRKMQENGITLICGPTGSSQALSALALGKQQDIVQAVFANAADIGDGTKYPTNYQCCFNSVQEATVVVDHMVRKLGVKKVGILQESTAYGEQVTAASRVELDKAGLKPTSVQSYPLTTLDFDPYVSNLRKSGAEGVLIWCSNTPQAAAALTALGAQQWFPPICGHNGMLVKSLVTLAPEAVLKNAYAIHFKTLSFTDTELPGTRQQAFATALQHYPDVEDYAVSVASAPYYDFIQLLRTVIEAEKSFEPSRIRKALDSTSGYAGLLGSYTFTPTMHSGLSLDALCMASILSANDPRARGCFRKQA